MNTNFPIKKTFHQDFLNEKGKGLFTVKYEQATIGEYYEYLQKSEQEQGEELMNILYKSIKFSLKEKIMKFFRKNYVTKTELGINIEESLISILNTRYKGYKSIFEDVKRKINKGGKKSKGSIDSVGLSSICKTYNMSPTDLMKNYTLEQYFWFLDGIEWINNSQDKEGQAVNDMAIIDKDAVKQRAEETKAKFAKLKK